MKFDVTVRPNRAGKLTDQRKLFSEGVTRLVHTAKKEQGCGVTVTQAAGWTTATVDPDIEPGRIHFVKF